MALSLIAYALAAASMPAHSTQVRHLGANYDVEYRTVVETSERMHRVAPPSRPHNMRCRITATFSVERHIAKSESAMPMKSMIEPQKVLEKTSYGRCANTEKRVEELVAANEGELASFLARAAEADRPAALAAIEAAHALAAN